MLYGESGAGKTFVGVDLAMSIARGEDWLGQKVRQAGVLYLAAEGAAGLSHRIAAYRKFHDLDEGLNLPFLAVTQAVDLMVYGHKQIAVTVREAGKRIGLIVIDTLNRSMLGDENNAEDMARVIAHASSLGKWLGCFVLIVHHSGKDASRGARGHSSLRAAVDVELEVTRTKEGRKVTLTKSRDGEDGLAFSVRLEQVKLGVDEDLDDITSCVAVLGGNLQEDGKTKSLGKWQRLVLQAVDEALASASPLLGGDLVFSVPVGEVLSLAEGNHHHVGQTKDTKAKDRWRESAKRALYSLVAQGVLVQKDGKVSYKSPQIYGM
jgi:hypothetical protein